MNGGYEFYKSMERAVKMKNIELSKKNVYDLFADANEYLHRAEVAYNEGYYPKARRLLSKAKTVRSEVQKMIANDNLRREIEKKKDKRYIYISLFVIISSITMILWFV